MGALRKGAVAARMTSFVSIYSRIWDTIGIPSSDLWEIVLALAATIQLNEPRLPDLSAQMLCHSPLWLPRRRGPRAWKVMSAARIAVRSASDMPAAYFACGRNAPRRRFAFD